MDTKKKIRENEKEETKGKKQKTNHTERVREKKEESKKREISVDSVVKRMKKKGKRRDKVVIGMSGGIDSLAAAYLLKEKGYEVIGLTLKLCEVTSNGADYAKRIAGELGIKHYLLNREEIFKEKVIKNFCREYRQGRTPNPCIRCNQFIKFRYLFKMAEDLGAKFVASGHYARIEYDDSKKRYLLKKGTDSQKEQSYLLYILSQSQLSRILLPLGNWTKSKVREKMKQLKFVGREKESQEICFIPGDNYRQFLKDWMPEVIRPGPIIDDKGKILGKHSGTAFYTIGQRKGLGLSNREPLYVTAVNPKTNTISVGLKENLYRKELIAERVRGIRHETRRIISNGVKAKIRYLHKEAEAEIVSQGRGSVLVKFKEPQRAITPGQAVVFYEGDVVLGGGVIKTVSKYQNDNAKFKITNNQITNTK